MEPSNGIYLKNVPLDMTSLQLKEKFFKDLDMDVKSDIVFPKKLSSLEKKTRVAFIQFATINEARMAIKLVNNAEFKDVRANFGKGNAQNGKLSRPSVNHKAYFVNDHACAFCGAKDSQLLCTGCSNMITGTYYCQEDHQARDWLRHKSECKVMPPLKQVDKPDDNPADVIESNSENGDDEVTSKPKYFIVPIDKKPAVGDKVYITSVSTPRVIYVLPVNENENYLKLLDDVQNTSKNMAKQTDKPEINNHILAPFRGSFHRAKVIDLFDIDSDGLNAKVYMADFGEEIRVKWQDCRELNYRLRGLKTYIFKFVLHGVQITDKNEEILNYLREIQGNKEALTVVEISQYGDRKILKRINDEIVNDKINELATVIASRKVSSDLKPILYNNLNLSKIEPGLDVKLYITDNSRLESDGMIACMPYEKFSDYFKLISNIKAFSRIINESYEPTVINELVLVKYKESWHRAVVLDLSLSPAEIEVVLIDLMIKLRVSAKNICKIPTELTKQFFTQFCHVDGLNEENIESAKKRTECGAVCVANIMINNKDKFPAFNYESINPLY